MLANTYAWPMLHLNACPGVPLLATPFVRTIGRLGQLSGFRGERRLGNTGPVLTMCSCIIPRNVRHGDTFDAVGDTVFRY